MINEWQLTNKSAKKVITWKVLIGIGRIVTDSTPVLDFITLNF